MGKAQHNARDHVAIGLQYARDVVDGKIAACRWVKLACQRQIDDLESCPGWIFDHEKANRFCKFAEYLPHVKGRWGSKNLILEPWQCFIFTTIFGWVDAEGFRRFRKALVVLPRKQGKSIMASAVALYGLALDKEPGAEVYAAATSRDQAKIVWDVARRMAQKLPDFCEAYGVTPLAHSITVESEGACFKPLSRDADSLEGLNPHFSIIDELHAHDVREVFDVLDEATGARRQPLMFIISTEGDNAAGVFAEQVSYAQQILEGNHQDDSYFGIYYSIDPQDDWTSRESWYKANPNLGISVFEKDMELRCRQAEKNAESQASFLTKRLNVRVGAGSAFFNLLAWNTICKDESLKIEDFYGKSCYVGVDLASAKDLAAVVSLFEDNTVFAKFYLPEEVINRGHQNYDLYRGWSTRGYLTLTPGNVTDFDFIQRDLITACQNHDVKQIGVDPANATQLTNNLEKEGLPAVIVRQSVLTLSEPMKLIDAAIISGMIRHDGNPVLTWNIGNVVAKKDLKDNVYPRKSRDENKIDGALGLIIARACKLREEDNRITYMGGFAS